MPEGKEITWDEVRKGDWLLIEQTLPADGPRLEYRIVSAGEVQEHNTKWTHLRYKAKTHSILQKYGEETITRFMKKDFTKYMKENYG